MDHPDPGPRAGEAAGLVHDPPTVLTLRTLARFETPGEAVAFAGSQETVPRIEPRLVIGEGGSIQILMPGQHGYDDPAVV